MYCVSDTLPHDFGIAVEWEVRLIVDGMNNILHIKVVRLANHDSSPGVEGCHGHYAIIKT